MKKRITYLSGILTEFNDIDLIPLRRERLNDLPHGWGIYQILSPNSVNLYIGISSRLKQRIRHDLLGISGAHIFKRKLYDWKKYSGAKAINYLNKCSIRFMKGKDTDIIALEHFAIAVLRPKYND